jgi:hypothetical protein
VSNKVIGGLAHQAPRNADLGTLAFQDSDSVGSIKARTIVAGRIPDTNDAYALTLSRIVGSSGVLRIIGDNYLTGNPHIKFELEPTAGATIKNGMISFDGDAIKQSTTRIDSSMGRDHQNGIPSLDIYHYNYPDDNTQNVPALRIRNGNSSADMKHHGFLSLEALFTGSAYDSPRIYFRNNANGSNDKAVIGMYGVSGTTGALNIVADLLGSSENYSDISEEQIAQFGQGIAIIRNSGHGTNPMLRLHQRQTRQNGQTSGIEFRDATNETNASIMVTNSSAGNSSANIQIRVDDGDGGNGLTDPPVSFQVNTNGIQLQPHYTAYYSYASTWVSSYQTVIPNTGLSPNASYLISIDTNNQSFGGNPYYAAASFVMMTSPGTNGSGTNTGSSFAAPTATHIQNSCSWEFTITTSVGGRNGVAVRLLNGPTFSNANGTQIRVQAFRLT